jgi:GntR family transcriptional regulator, transcriptional repressor for pyruvate dehydrogenase complex
VESVESAGVLSRTDPVPSRNVKLAEVVAKRIADDIFAQQLAPGAKLPGERHMVERFQVSRGTLREALRILEVHGLLTIRSGPGGGPTVSHMTANDFNRACSLHFTAAGITVSELWAAREKLEPLLARSAAEALNESDRIAFEELLREQSDDGVIDNARYVRVGSRFHELIASASGSPVLSLFARALGEMTAQLESRNVFPPSEHGRVHQAHLDIVDAILNRDADTAERLAAEHMSDMRGTHRDRYPGLMDNVLPYVI